LAHVVHAANEVTGSRRTVDASSTTARIRKKQLTKPEHTTCSESFSTLIARSKNLNKRPL